MPRSAWSPKDGNSLYGAGTGGGDGLPRLPAAGVGNRGLREQRSGGATGMELERAGAAAAIRHPHRDRMRARSEIDIPVFCPITRGGISQVDRKSTRLNSSHLGISYAV